jgi:uncharacterized membrane protein
MRTARAFIYRHKTAAFWSVTGFLSLVAATLTYYIGVQQSIWFDEAHTLLLAHQPASQLVHLAALDVHPPMYFLIVKAWASVFGWSDGALRLLGAYMAPALVVTGALLAKKLFGKRAGLLAATFIALSPFIIRYDFELRMYSLAAIIAVLATYVFVKAVNNTTSRKHQWWLWVTYAVLVAVGMYTVYYTAFIWLGHATWLFIKAEQARHREKQRISQTMRQGLLAYALALVLWLPWLFVFVTQLTNGALANITEPLTATNTLGFISFAFLYQPFGQLTMLQSLMFGGVIAAIVTLIIYTRRTSPRPSYLGLISTIVIVPFALLALVSLVKPLYVERYLVPVVPFFFIMVAGLCAAAFTVKPIATRRLAGILVVICCFGLVQLAHVGNFNFQRNESIMTKQAVAAFEARCQPGTVILANDPYVYIQSLPYFTSSCPFLFYEPSEVLRGGYAGVSGSSQQVKNQASLGTPARIVYVYYDRPAFAIPDSYRQIDKRAFGNLFILTYVSGAVTAE